MESLKCYLETNSASRLADMIGVTKAYIWQLKEGKTHPSLKRAFQIEDATGGQVPARAWVA